MLETLAAKTNIVETYGTLIMIVSGFLVLSAALRLLWKKIIIPLARIDGAVPTLIKIADEFKENGGNSLKDRINKIEDQQSKIDKKIDELESKSEKLTRYIDVYMSSRQTLGPRNSEDWFQGMAITDKELEF